MADVLPTGSATRRWPDTTAGGVDVSVVIVTWNSAGFLGDCLRAIAPAAGGRRVAVTVVDNGSGDGTVGVVDRDFPGVRLIETGANLGFAPASNIGLRLAEGRFVLLLNPDTRLGPGAIDTLARVLETRPDAGAAGPRIVRNDGSPDLFAAREPPSVRATIARHFGLRRLFPDSRWFGREARAVAAGRAAGPQPVPCLTGAALMVPRAVLDEVGLLDERLPMYFEDLDLCARIERSGRRLYYVPAALLVHPGGRSAELSPQRATLYAMENGQAPWLYLRSYGRPGAAACFTAAIAAGSAFRLALLAPAALAAALVGHAAARPLRARAWGARVLLAWALRGKARFAERLTGFAAEPALPVPGATGSARRGAVPRGAPRGAAIAARGTRVSILIHNVNRASALVGCLESVAAQRYRPLEVVIFDAGSTDDSPAVIRRAAAAMRERGLRVRVERCPMLGVPASRNLMARHATGTILCGLDNDASFTAPDAVDRLVACFAADPRLAVASFRVLRGDTDEIDPFAWVFRRPVARWADRPFETFTFAGTGFAIRADAFHEAGGFWEQLRYSREEEDLGLALIDRGWRLRYAPEITIRHYADARGRMLLRERRATELRNGILVLWRRLPIPLAVPAVAGRLATMSVRGWLRERHPPAALWRAMPEAAREWSDAGLRREPVRYRSALSYAALHFRA